MALFLDVGLADVLMIGDAQITVERKSGTRARLRITNAPAQVTLLRNQRTDQPPRNSVDTKRISAANTEHTHGKHPF